MAVLIFAFGVLGLIGLEAQAINFSIDAEDRNRAALFASDIASYMWLNGSVAVSATQYATWQAAIKVPTGTGLPGGTLSITPTAGTTNSADILITWVAQSEQSATAATSPTHQLTTRVTVPVLP